MCKDTEAKTKQDELIVVEESSPKWSANNTADYSRTDSATGSTNPPEDVNQAAKLLINHDQ